MKSSTPLADLFKDLTLHPDIIDVKLTSRKGIELKHLKLSQPFFFSKDPDGVEETVAPFKVARPAKEYGYGTTGIFSSLEERAGAQNEIRAFIDVNVIQRLVEVDALLAQKPPEKAVLLLFIFYSRSSREAILENLEADFYEAMERFNLKTARRLYYWGVLRSFGPAVAGFLAGGGFFRAVAAIYHKFVS